MKDLEFVIGQRVCGYLVEDGLPFIGIITSFGDVHPKTQRAVTTVKIESSGEYCEAYSDTFHPIPLDKVTHSKQTFLAAASRCGPVLYFKDSKARRDFLEGFWFELQNSSNN